MLYSISIVNNCQYNKPAYQSQCLISLLIGEGVGVTNNKQQSEDVIFFPPLFPTPGRGGAGVGGVGDYAICITAGKLRRAAYTILPDPGQHGASSIITFIGTTNAHLSFLPARTTRQRFWQQFSSFYLVIDAKG